MTAAGLAFGAACWMACGPAVAGDIVVRAGDCRSAVELSATHERVTDVLARLATALDFQLRVDGTVESRVTLEMSAPAPELIAAVAAAHGSFMIRHARDARCPGRTRVAAIWLTASAARASSPQATPASVSKPRPAIVAVTETATPQRLRQVEDDARRRQLAYEDHVRHHGKPPPGEPEEIGALDGAANQRSGNRAR